MSRRAFFFEDRFFKKGFNSETKGLLSDRIFGIISVPAFARMLTAKENKLDLFEAINSGKTILVNTAKTSWAMLSLYSADTS